MQLSFLRAVKAHAIFFLSFVLLFTTGCEDDDHDNHDHGHTDADGFILESNGTEIYREFEGSVTGSVTLNVGDTLELAVHFLDHEGEEIEHEEEEGEEHEEGELEVSGANASVAIVEVEHEEEGDDHEDHHDHHDHHGHDDEKETHSEFIVKRENKFESSKQVSSLTADFLTKLHDLDVVSLSVINNDSQHFKTLTKTKPAADL